MRTKRSKILKTIVLSEVALILMIYIVSVKIIDSKREVTDCPPFNLDISNIDGMSVTGYKIHDFIKLIDNKNIPMKITVIVDEKESIIYNITGDNVYKVDDSKNDKIPPLEVFEMSTDKDHLGNICGFTFVDD